MSVIAIPILRKEKENKLYPVQKTERWRSLFWPEKPNTIAIVTNSTRKKDQLKEEVNFKDPFSLVTSCTVGIYKKVVLWLLCDVLFSFNYTVFKMLLVPFFIHLWFLCSHLFHNESTVSHRRRCKHLSHQAHRLRVTEFNDKLRWWKTRHKLSFMNIKH